MLARSPMSLVLNNSKVEYYLHQQKQWHILENILLLQNNSLGWGNASLLFQVEDLPLNFCPLVEVLGDGWEPTAIHTLAKLPQPLRMPHPHSFSLSSLSSYHFPTSSSQLRSCFSLFKSAFFNEKKANRSYQSSFTYLSSSWQKSRLKPICAGGRGSLLPRSLFLIHWGLHLLPHRRGPTSV